MVRLWLAAYSLTSVCSSFVRRIKIRSLLGFSNLGLPIFAIRCQPPFTILSLQYYLCAIKSILFGAQKKIDFILLTYLHPKRFQILLKDWNAYKGNSVDFIHGTSFLRKFHKTVLTHRIPFRPLVISYKLFLLYFCLHSPPLS